MFDRFNSLIATKLPYRFRVGLVYGPSMGGGGPNGGDHGHGNGDGAGSSGHGGDNDGGDGSGAKSGGMSPDAKEGSIESGYPGTPDPSGNTDKTKSLGNALKSALKGFSIGSMLAGLPGGVLGALANGIKGFTDSEIDQVAGNLKAKAKESGVDLSDDEANQLARDTISALSNNSNTGVGTNTGTGSESGNGSEHVIDNVLNDVIDGKVETTNPEQTGDGGKTMTDFNADLWQEVMSTVYPDYTPESADNTNQVPINEGDPTNIDDNGNIVDPVKVVDPGEQTPEETVKSLKDLIFDSANHTREAAEGYQDTIQGAEKKQGKTLDSLIEQYSNGTGMGKPVSFRVMGQDISFVPGANRRMGETISQWGQKGFENTTGTAANVLATSALTDQSNAGLTYFDKIHALAKDADARKYRDDALEKGFAIDQQQVDQNEASGSDKLKQFIDIFVGGKKLYDSGDESGWW